MRGRQDRRHGRGALRRARVRPRTRRRCPCRCWSSAAPASPRETPARRRRAHWFRCGREKSVECDHAREREQVEDVRRRQAQQLGDLAIAIAAVLPSKLDNIGGGTLLVVTTARDLALRRAMLPERRTGATLGDMQLRSHLLNTGTATRGA